MDGANRRSRGGERKLAGGSAAGDDRRMIDRVMMLRFRPIAPKPADGVHPAGVDQFGNKSLLFSGIRTKRKYVRVRSRNKNSKSSGQLERAEPPSEKAVVTLQLLPNKVDYEGESSESGGFGEHHLQQSAPSSSSVAVQSSILISPSLTTNSQPWLPDCMSLQFPDPMATTARRIESWITVESVSTGACPDALELGRSDEEKTERLGSSACPGLVSDLSNQVLCVNYGYLEMVRRGFTGTNCDDQLVAVGLSVRAELGGLPRWCGAFTCHVRVQDTWQEERRSRVVPCDVWRMDCGGFAWRLDVKTALSLGCS
ncbi:hypothetical protein SAY87_005173 [Trapa incisa]|uniref:DUF7950 domain-containing protein n=1 Tax=Trapa incisa TaxID=236973 RepID=A0AAN7QBA4_9MYRT|nr:hypothetical protein SAY87_005173 [Trapa incisa]